jgi:quinol-cytochrome oxidoreductase complex cytochrome b subunit
MPPASLARSSGIVGVYMAGVRIYEALTGRILAWDGVEAEALSALESGSGPSRS